MGAITAAEILWKYTTTAGAAGNATVNTAVGTFLGKYASSSNWAGGAANDLFADITGAQNAASQVDYAGLAIHNSNTLNPLLNPTAYISAETAGGASVSIGVDPTAASAVGAAPAQLVTIANSTTAPAGVTFTSPTTSATGVALASIPIGNVKGLWIRRSAANTAALSGDGATVAVTGDTGSL